MKKIANGLLTAALLSVSVAFAADSACPPDNIIKTVKFTQASKNIYLEDTWYLLSSPISVNGSEWNVWYTAKLADAKTPAEAIKQGQEVFDHASLTKVDSRKDGKQRTICIYDGFNISLSAVNPPIYGWSDSSVASLRK